MGKKGKNRLTVINRGVFLSLMRLINVIQKTFSQQKKLLGELVNFMPEAICKI
jgi:hypothetical protein